MGKQKLVVLAGVLAAAIGLAYLMNEAPSKAGADDPLSAAADIEERVRGNTPSKPATEETYTGTPSKSSGAVTAANDVAQGSAPALKYGEHDRSTDPINASTATGEPVPRTPDLLLDASARKSALDAGPVAAGIRTPEAPIILRNFQGLSESGSSDYKLYRVRKGDTWTGLAQRFYRDGRFTRNLRQANEGKEDLAGEILVPVYDFIAEAGQRDALRPVRVPSRTTASATPSAARTEAPPKVAYDGKARIHEVGKGDTLSELSLRYYGTATRWYDLYLANRDQLESPDWLKLGMKLQIPALDLSKKPALPPGQRVAETRSESRPSGNKVK